MSFLTLKSVCKEYKTDAGVFVALNDISFELENGEFVVILGPSGAGKTTLLNLLGGMDTVTSGEILLDGNKVSALTKKQLADYRRTEIGFVFQFYNLMPNLTALENVELSTEICKNALSPAKTLEDVGLGEKFKNFPAQLSGGEQQRVSIARAIAKNPKILLCDEATSALDPTTTKSILALLKEINERYGITIVIITHEMAVVQEICTHVAIIDGGALAETGTVEEVFARPKTAAAKRLVFQNGGNYQEMKGKRCIRIVFKENSSFEPVIGNMVLECKAPANILLADTKDIGGVAHGQMILQLPEDEITAGKMINYLKDRKLEVEELDNYVG